VTSRLKRASAPSDHQGMFLSRILVLLMAMATVGSAGVLWAKPPTKPQSTTTTQTTTAPAPPANAKAYGRYCQNQGKRHVPGQKGTPFSQCVTAMAKAARGQSPAACALLSKKHVAGEKGTPFSRCVAGAAQLKRDQQKQHA
jgi:hypothetical protein